MNNVVDSVIADEVYDEFLDLIRDTESILMQLENDLSNTELVREIFRPFHTIKGNAGMIGDSKLQDFTQLIETVLDQVRQGMRDLTIEIVNVALAANDVIRQIAISKTSDGFENQIEEVGKQLMNLSLEEEQEKVSAGSRDIPVLTVPIAKRSVQLLHSLRNNLDEIVFKKNFDDYLFPFYDDLIAFSQIYENKAEFSEMLRLVSLLEEYLNLLSNDGCDYSDAKGQLIRLFYNNIFDSIYHILLHNLNIKVFYWNDNEDAESVIDYLNYFQEYYFVIVINKLQTPHQSDIEDLNVLSEKYSDRVNFLLRLSQKANNWKNMIMFHDFECKIHSSFMSALNSLTEKI